MSAGPKALCLNFIATTQEMADEMLEKYAKYFDGVEYEVGVITESFSDVRNKVLERSKEKYEYMFWVDTDDEVIGIEKLRGLVELMAEHGVDALYFPYEYAHNEQGECIVLQWRERIVKLSHPFQWMGAIHESIISVSKPMLDRTEDVVIRHQKSTGSHHESAARNHQFLLAEYKKEQRDPRITHYLALSFFNLGDYNKAIKLFREHIRTSGWDEDQYRSYFYIGQAYGLQNKNKEVLEAAAQAMKLIPVRPEAYVLAATAEFELGHHDKCIQWLQVAGQKPAPRESLSAIDPTYYTYKAEFLAAQAFLRSGQIKEAHDQLKLVLQHSPNFQPAIELAPLFQEIYDDQVAVTRLQWLTDYLGHYGGDNKKLFEALPARLMADPRLNETRVKIFPPVKWPKTSIVFFCGQSLESWGPDTLKDGMSGSEEAIVYLSRALAKIGWDVTVYNDRERPYTDSALEDGAGPVIHYLPWTQFNPQDEFSTIVAWRNPTFYARVPVKAKMKVVDLHDMPYSLPPIEEYIDSVDKFLVKSEYQRKIYGIPKEKAAVVSNGVDISHFSTSRDRRSHSVGYYSSYDRGLECLLRLWPAVRKEVPDATLDIYYGWNWFDIIQKNNPEAMKWKLSILKNISKLKSQGVKEHGRVDHTTLADAMLETEVWAYPTQFEEINCMTAIKTGLAGQIPVTSGYAALQETVKEKQKNYCEPDNDLYNNKQRQDEFVAELVTALKEGRTEDERATKAKAYLGFDWSAIAQQWAKQLAS